MSRLEILLEILADHFQVDEESITPETSLRKDLGADSLDICQLFDGDFWEAFEVDFTAEDVAKLDTVGDILAFIEWIETICPHCGQSRTYYDGWNCPTEGCDS